MIDTKPLEYKIFACIILKPKLLENMEIEEKYFTEQKIFKFLKTLHEKYGYVDIQLIAKHSKDKGKSLGFISEALSQEVSATHINGYYKQLREDFRSNQINDVSTRFKSREITYKEFTKQMYEINKEDFDEDELLDINKIATDDQVEREYTNIRELDFLLKGIEYGRVSLWSGITNHGKTTLMIQFAKECLKKHKKIFYFSGEQTASEFKNYLYVGLCGGKDQLKYVTDKHNERIVDVKPKDEVVEYLDNIYAKDIYLYNNNIPENNIARMLKVMTKAFNQGVRVFFIDNFMQLDNSERLEEQTKIVETFKRFARDKNCIVNLVAHPRKTQFMKNRLTIFDIAGTQNIANKSANICTIIRTDILPDDEYESLGKLLLSNGYDIKNCDGIVEVIKTKGNSCKAVGLKYDFETRTYKEAKRLSKEDMELINENKKKRKRQYDD